MKHTRPNSQQHFLLTSWFSAGARLLLARPPLLAVLTLVTIFSSACAYQAVSEAAAASPVATLASPETAAANETLPLSTTTGLEDPGAQLKVAGDSTQPPVFATLDPQYPAVAWAEAEPCPEPAACASLLVTQGGNLERLEWSGSAVQSITAPSLLPAQQTQDGRWKIDTAVAAPDGKWAAFTSIGNETGGPVFLQDLETGASINLITELNAKLSAGTQPFPEDYWWDVIGWFPDSQSLMIGPTDLSFVVIVDRASFASTVLPFPGGGRGGRAFTSLASDGTRFLYIGEDSSGAQVLNDVDLASGKTATLYSLPYSQGILMNPRYSPDNRSVAYIVQQGPSGQGSADHMDLLAINAGKPRVLVEGSLPLAVPIWSPDGQQIAYTRSEPGETSLLAQGTFPEARGNVWVISLAGGTQTQITFIDGLARSPAWTSDGKTLGFVTHDGQVGLARPEEPGKIWQAAGPSPDAPELTSVFFLP